MIKNVLQAVIYVLVAVMIGLASNVTVPVFILVIGAVLAAFERSRYLSAFEVGVTTIAIVFAMKGWWIPSIILLGLLIIENLAFIFGPLRQKLIQLDEQRAVEMGNGEG